MLLLLVPPAELDVDEGAVDVVLGPPDPTTPTPALDVPLDEDADDCEISDDWLESCEDADVAKVVVGKGVV